jgi:competence protein ComEC
VANSPGKWWRWRRAAAALRTLTRIQFVLLFGLMPMTLALFGRVSLLAPLTNMLVVPIFNLVTVPFCLLGLLLDGPLVQAGNLLIHVAHASIEIALSAIGWIGRWPFSSAEPPLGGYRVIFVAGCTVIWAILPPGWPGRHLAFVAFAATLLYKPPTVPTNCLDVHALDVGQGLAVVLRTRRHTLVYDTGPSFASGSSTAKLVIGPFLKANGVSTIDTLVVSHADLDHSGGARWLADAFDIDQLMLGEALKRPVGPGTACSAGRVWQWDGIDFRFLHPDSAGRWHGNNASCVLLVQIGEHKLLIPGDIEAPAENSIVSGQVVGQVDLVVVPHHGSRTSSSPGFVDMLRPSLAIVPAGYRNRWGFPKPDITARWEDSGARVLTTGQVGAVSRRYCAGNPAGPLRLERDHSRRYWHDTGA